MNINHQLFKSITDNLNIVLDTVPAHQKTETKEYEYYAMDVAFSSLMAFYSCPDLTKKDQIKLLSSVFECGVFVRNLCDTEKDIEKRHTLIFDFLENYDIWTDGWLEKLLPDEEVRKDVEICRDLTIEETTCLTYQNFGIEITDNGKLQDMITVLIAVFMFGSRIYCRNFAMVER